MCFAIVVSVADDADIRFEYYRSALDCTLNGGDDRKPDLWALPDDGSVPRW